MNTEELQDFIKEDLLVILPDILSAFASLSKSIQELTDAINRLKE